MNYQKIRRSSAVLAIGYLFLTIYIYISLADIPGLEASAVVKPAFYIGFTLLSVGPLFATKEHKYFKASFIAFLCLDVLILFLMVNLNLYAYQPSFRNTINTILKVNYAFNNAFLALGNGLFTNGIKEVYAARKNKKMYAYAMTMEYGVTGLLLLSTVLSLINFEGMSLYVATGVSVGLSTLIYGGYSVFMFIIVHTLKEKSKKKIK